MKKPMTLLALLLTQAGLALAAVNINSATREQLETLEGIGPVKAQAILDYRTRHGLFLKVEDLKKVEGIGDATFDRLKGDIAVSGVTRIPGPADRKADDPKARSRDTK